MKLSESAASFVTNEQDGRSRKQRGAFQLPRWSGGQPLHPIHPQDEAAFTTGQTLFVDGGAGLGSV